MRKRMSNTIWGLIFILFGLGIAGRALFGWNFTIFFDGWWTLFIIVPCALGLLEKGWGSGNGIGLLIGLFLFLGCQDFIPAGLFGKLLIPVILMIIGFSILFKGTFNGSKHVHINMEIGPNDYVGIFNGQKIRYPREKFNGCTANAVFGGVDIDLRDAIIDEDVVIEATAVFGGIDIFVPPHVRVKVSSVPLFGSVGNKTMEPADINAPTVFVNATCMFGGVDIK